MATYIPGISETFPGPAPFEPDFQFIDTMLRRRQYMYEQGYSQVSSAYKSLNRNLTNPMNVQTRDVFLKQAESNLKNLAAMDLSLPQNVESASNVFRPFYENTDVLADMSLTSHWDKQESIAEMYRTKDGGKEFSQDNLNYVRIQRSNFAQDNPSNWQSYMSNKRSYTPYYDWNKEFLDYMKDHYKPNKKSVKRRNGYYNIVEESTGATAEDLKLFFTSVASNKAKEQMRIESAVRIGETAEQIAPEYKRVAQKEVETINEQLGIIDNQLKLTTSKEEREQLQALRKMREEQLGERKRDIENIDKGDVEFLRQNAGRWAFSLYFDQAVGKLAKGLSWEDYKYDFDSDDVAMEFYKQGEEWKRLMYKERNANYRAAMSAASRRKRGDNDDDDDDDDEGEMGDVNVVNLPDFNNTNNEAQDMGALETQSRNLNQQKAEQATLLRKHVARALQKDPSKVTAMDIVTYSKSEVGQRDAVYMNYKRAISGIGIKQDMVNESIQQAKDVARKSAAPVYNAIQQKLKPLDNLGKEAGITGEEMYHGILTGRVKLGKTMPVITGPYMGTNAVKDYIEIDGKQYVVNNNSNLLKLFKEANALVNSKSTASYNNALKAHFDKPETRNIGKGIILGVDDKRYKKSLNQLATITGLDPTKLQGLVYGGKNDLYFAVDNEKANSDFKGFASELQARAAQLGLNLKVDEKSKMFYISENPGVSKVTLGADIYEGYTPNEKMFINYGETQARDGYQSPHFYPGDRQFDKYGKPIRPFHYQVVEEGGNKLYYLYNDHESVRRNYLGQYSNLSDLFTDANSIANDYSMFIDAAQKIK